VNGGLLSGSSGVPRFGRIARSYLDHIDTLDWTKITPDIFGSMIQAVAEDEKRGALGMHDTSMPTAIIIWIALAALAFLLLPSRGRAGYKLMVSEKKHSAASTAAPVGPLR